MQQSEMQRPMKPVPTTSILSDRYFQRYWIHVEVRMNVSKLRKLIALHARKKPYTKFRDQAHYFIEGRKLSKRGMSLLDAAILPLNQTQTVPENARNFLLADVQGVLDRLNQEREYDGDSGTHFLFPRNKFRFKGGFSLPIKFGMDEAVKESLGIAEVRGLQLVFDESPIGLDGALLSVSDRYKTLGIQTSFYSSPVSGLVAQTYMQAKKIGTLFVEGETT
jgi:hypothetical protein